MVFAVLFLLLLGVKSASHKLTGNFRDSSPKYKMHLMQMHPYAKSVDGREMPLMVVLKETIKYISNKAIAKLQEQVGKLVSSKIRWVITVPALWSEEHKYQMRKAALEAGIIEQVNSPNLFLSLEVSHSARRRRARSNSPRPRACSNSRMPQNFLGRLLISVTALMIKWKIAHTASPDSLKAPRYSAEKMPRCS